MLCSSVSGEACAPSPDLGHILQCMECCQPAGLSMALGAVLARGRAVCRRNGLLILSVLSVIVGCLLGFFLRTQRLSQQVRPPGCVGFPVSMPEVS